MLFLVVGTAHALLVPDACPTIVTAADAHAWYDADHGVDDAFDAVDTAMGTWWDGSCAWTADGAGEACTTAAGASLYRYDVTEVWDVESVRTVITTVDLPAGADTWTHIGHEYVYTNCGSLCETVDDGYTWTGSLPDLPDDGTITSSSLSDYTDTGVAYSVPGCSWSWNFYVPGPTWSVSFDSQPDVYVTNDRECHEYAYRAYVGGELFGAVGDGWELVEVDQDGFEPDVDCDDTDPDIHPCADEVAHDGVDQDCDGVDLLDGDGDGADADFAGGTDCDDTDALVHPGADDPAGDGVDQDCDGADDVDADGDGFTADGDDTEADCDDAEASAHPGGREVANDGIDQDCDGADLVTTDTGEPSDTAEPADTGDTGERAVRADEPRRCGGRGGAAVMLLVLSAMRGRARARGRPLDTPGRTR